MDQPSKELYITDNIIIGTGEVPARRAKEGIVWVLPGGRTTTNRDEAIRYAIKLDKIIQSNLTRQSKRTWRQQI